MINNKKIIKYLGLSTGFIILFLPVTGCQGINFSGWDIMFNDQVDFSFKLLLFGAVVCSILIYLATEKEKTYNLGLIGAGILALLYILFKLKIRSSDMGQFFSLKIGAYLSFLGFIAIAVISKMKEQVYDLIQEWKEEFIQNQE